MKLIPPCAAFALAAALFAFASPTRAAAPAAATTGHAPLAAAPPYYQVHYPASTRPGELAFAVTYSVWIPPAIKTLRGVIVHQHGCGENAARSGETAAYDLHWQALAKKWECALLAPSYQQPQSGECLLWSDPRNGSGPAFLRALGELGEKSGHPELARIPWALWGHSGGANWAGTMLQLHPERIAAVWLRSGAPGLLPSGDAAPPLATPAAALGVPVMVNPGVKEKTHPRFHRVWEIALSFFTDTRARGGLVGFAPDPRTGHECGDSRYLAIPFFDACLAQRLPATPGAVTLEPMNAALAWLAPLQGDTAQPTARYSAPANEAVWLPNATVAKAWRDYVKTGATADDTPPPAPTRLRLTHSAVLTWEAEPDFESGLAGFIVERDGVELARLPEKSVGQFGRPLFQTMSYNDTPTRPLPEMRFTDTTAQPGVTHTYRVTTINSVGLESAPSPTASQ